MAAVQSTVSTVSPSPLYVGDLHPDVTEGQLLDAFSEFKSLTSVRVCRDSSSGRSLCYGYVNFISQQDAIRAIKAKNHTPLNGKMIRVMWSHRDPNARKSGVGNIFVKNLCESIDNVGLQEMFEKFGTIISCKVATFEDGTSKGYGFVQFESEDSANDAIEKLNGSTILDKQLYVGKFVKKSDRVLPSPNAKYTNLYVKNLGPDVTEELLQEKFSEFGKIVSLVLAKDDDGASRGFGFVNFDSSDDAKRALEVMNGSQLGSKILYVSRAQKKAEREQVLHRQFEEKRKEQILKFRGSNVYVKNVDDDITDEELKERFSQCGTITSAKLMRDEKGISKGFGFVCFSTPEEASKAVSTFHGHMFHRKPLYVAIAQRKEERHAQLQLQYAQRMAGLAVGSSNTVIPGGYPPLYYTAPSSGLSHVHPRPGLMYQPFGLRPGWRGDGFAPPTRPALQPPTFPFIPNASRQIRQNRGRMNGHVLPQTSAQTVSYMPHIQHSTLAMTSSKDLNSQQRSGQTKYVTNSRPREMFKGSSTVSNTEGTMSQGSEMLSSLLAAAPPEQQKQILGERLYPLVEKRQPPLI